MPSFTQSLPQQNQAAAAGIYRYPQTTSCVANTVFIDEFLRTTFQPTTWPALYLTTTTGTGTYTIQANRQLLLTTTASANDCNNVSLSEMVLQRSCFSSASPIDGRSNMNIDIYFNLGQTTACKIFLGLVRAANSPLTALPTTQGHMGLRYDSTGDSDFILTSSDNTTQTTTDTGIAVNTTFFSRINISWTGTNTAVISFFNNSTSTTADKTQTVSALGGVTEYIFNCFILTTTTAAKTLVLRTFKVQTV